ncbi:hypothetical protein E4U31_003621, partial [Claviceps sp. LM219 group G6]
MTSTNPPADVPLPKEEHDIKMWQQRVAVIVPLKGAENFEEWNISIEMQARNMGYIDHLLGDIPHSPATDKYHGVLTSIIWQSLSPRMQRNLSHAGWTSRMRVTGMMDLIKTDCGFEADIAIMELLARFHESSRSNFATT